MNDGGHVNHVHIEEQCRQHGTRWVPFEKRQMRGNDLTNSSSFSRRENIYKQRLRERGRTDICENRGIRRISDPPLESIHITKPLAMHALYKRPQRSTSHEFAISKLRDPRVSRCPPRPVPGMHWEWRRGCAKISACLSPNSHPRAILCRVQSILHKFTSSFSLLPGPSLSL